MKNRLLFLLKYYLFWLFFAFLARTLFLTFFWKLTYGFSPSEFGMIFWKGLRMDLSLGGYVLMASCALMAIFVFLPQKWIKPFFRGFTIVLLIVFTAVALGDIQAFKVWGYHLDGAVIDYLKTPKEAFASASAGVWISSIAIFLVLVAALYFLFEKFVLPKNEFGNKAWWQSLIYLVLGGVLIIPVRGGFNLSPMNVSFAYFSNKFPFANQAAVNSVWNFIWEALHHNERKASFHFMDQSEADTVLDSLYTTSNNFPHLLTLEKPNVVVILLEGFTANAIGVLDGKSDVTPNLNNLTKEGLLFSQIYATGARSDRGLAAVLAAIPAHPAVSVLGIPKRVGVLHAFSRDFESRGYDTRFYYAGDLNFFGFRAFTTSNFQHLTTENDFSGESTEKTMKWGVHDEYMFDKLFEDIQKSTNPSLFFAFTLSSHEPFSVPGEKRVEGNTLEKKFLNSMAYTDAELGRFIEKCKTSGIWDNTLFVFIADHGVRYVGNPDPNMPESFHIPLIFTGGPLSVRDSVITTIGSQTDLAATLLSQFDMDHSIYKYSRNLLADSIPQTAFYANPSVVGMVSQKGVTVYDVQGRNFLKGDSIKSNSLELKAYLQTIDSEQMD